MYLRRSRHHNPEPRTLNLELSIVIPVPAVYNSYMITIL